jgi:hypothetical protein
MLHASMLQMELRSESIDVTLQLEVKYEPLHTVSTLQLEVKDEPSILSFLKSADFF